MALANGYEDISKSVKVEWSTMKDKWFKGEHIDPVYEGIVRDFCLFDEKLMRIAKQVDAFMKGMEAMSKGLSVLSEGIHSELSHSAEFQISSDSCKFKEANNQISRSDAPHSAIAKLRRDLAFNIQTPMQRHLANNRQLKTSLEIRQRRLSELKVAKKSLEDARKNHGERDPRYFQAKQGMETVKRVFEQIDRQVFEWLYILEEYRGDILDSTLQTLKYLEYEFFAAAAHKISAVLPAQMEFRPMVEMTPEHLEAQVEMELKEVEECSTPATASEDPIIDFSIRLIEKKAKEESGGDSSPALPVDPLSLSSLLSQGFEEGPARRALRLHQNNTQEAMDWLVSGQGEAEKQKQVMEGVRMPTTVKRMARLKAMRKAQREKASNRGARDENGDRSPERSESTSPSKSPPTSSPQKRQPEAPQDLLDLAGDSAASPGLRNDSGVADLLSLDLEEPAVPTDFSKPVERTALPEQLAFDASLCSKPPLAGAVAAGIAQPRTCDGPADGAAPQQDMLQAIQALAAKSGMNAEQLLQAAQQLSANAQAETGANAASLPMGGYTGMQGLMLPTSG
eukprot:TRINITY_DN17289_c0_g1_i1.p1 TRINITY_DN17289_c0_g1~~TRINITY_DN17289_c0_g1_i1.p1  ORF type:complete len:567 (+),score=164.86 TRINITY_DN17289_c0_g1_i1:58-1758(+)